MSQPEERRSPGHKRKVFTEAEVRRMLRAREDGVPDAEIGKRFGVSAAMVATLIGRKTVRE